MAETFIHKVVALAREGKNPHVIARMASGWAVVGDRQVVRGYCLLLPDPVVPDLNALTGEARAQYLLDMVALGDVLLESPAPSGSTTRFSATPSRRCMRISSRATPTSPPSCAAARCGCTTGRRRSRSGRRNTRRLLRRCGNCFHR
jgi:hypothetical protein